MVRGKKISGKGPGKEESPAGPKKGPVKRKFWRKNKIKKSHRISLPAPKDVQRCHHDPTYMKP